MSYTMSHLVDGNVNYLALVEIQKRTKQRKKRKILVLN